MFHLEDLELLLDDPLVDELMVLFVCVEVWNLQLCTPPWRSVLFHGAKDTTSVSIVNNDLVVDGFAERPDFILIETHIDLGYVGIGRIRVEGLTLCVIEVKFFISVSLSEHITSADGGAFLWHARFYTLKVVSLSQFDIIHVCKLRIVRSQILIESHEGVVEHQIIHLPINNALHADVKTSVILGGAVLVVSNILMVDVGAAIGATKATLLPVHVDAPEVIHTVADGLTVAVVADEVRGYGEESNILDLKLEDG